MPFAFLAPLALAALCLVALPIVVHMLRRSKSRRLDFPNLRFLRETPSLVRRLTPPNRRWLLALRIAIIALIALAAARPAWTGDLAASGSATVVLLDASASMSRPGAGDAATAAAQDVLGLLGSADTASIAQFDRQVTWLARNVSRDEAMEALSRFAPGQAAGEPSTALAEVERFLADSPSLNRRVVIVSDFQLSNGPWTTAVSDSTSAVEVIRIENPFANAFVADARVEAGKNGEDLVCSVVRTGDAGRATTRSVAPLVDGAASDGLLVSRDSATWTARVIAPDEFDVDDVRFGVVGSRGPTVVCDPGAGAPFLAAAARVNDGDAAVSVAPRLDATTLAGKSVAILSSRALDVAGASSALEEWIRNGGTALVFAASSLPGTDAIPGVSDGSASPATVSLADSPSTPAAVALRVGRLRAALVEARDGDDVLARDGDGRAVIVRRLVGTGSVTVAGFDASPASGRLVYDGGFPDVVRVLSQRRGDDGLDVGDTLTDLPVDSVVEVGGRRVPVQSDGTLRIDEAGVVRISSPAGVRTLVANVPVIESESGQLSADAVAALGRPAGAGGVSPAAVLAASEQRWPIWRILLALALVAALAELAYVCATQRRSTPAASTADDVALSA